MYVRRLSLTNFRCYERLELRLPSGPIVIVGDNAQGKSSLLEAIYVLATTRSPHAASERELIRWAARDEVLPHGRVRGEVVRGDETRTVEVLCALRDEGPGETRFAKRVRLDDVPRRALDVLGVLNVVLFAPRDLELVYAGPNVRRRYLDVLLCQIDPAYCTALSAFNRALTQRNHLLRALRDRGGDPAELGFWDERVAAEAATLLAKRLAAAARLGALAGTVHAELAGRPAPLEVTYASTLERAAPGALPDPAGDGPPPEPGPLRAALVAALEDRRAEEIARGVTTLGPHRDDLRFVLDGADVRTFGSRGQQRTVTLAMKLAEAQLMWRETGERPVVLLDDVLSELDAGRRRDVLGRLDGLGQTLITTTDLAPLPDAFLARALVLRVEAAEIVEARRGDEVITPPVA